MIGQFAAAAAVLASVARAQNFIYPGAGQSVVYNVNQQLEVSWNSPYQYTFVDLYQGAPWVYAQVANATSSQTSYTWTAAALANSNYQGSTFFFRMGNALDPNAPTADSGDITLMPASNGVTTGSSVAGPSATSTGAPSSTDAHAGASAASSTAVSSTATSAAASTGSSSTAAAAAPAATTDSSSSAAGHTGSDTSAASSEPHYNWLPSYLGVGLGVGIPVLLAAIAGIWYSIHSKRKLARESVALEKGRGAP